ncbi:tRNA preQ1(34) S-adenosylmethionine ribosyltransferase-isomerase QueA [Sinanaerobacter chloroacetimidivorans]|jgi:S-adenosylmethionine:tRNA ribosyltransferase-isomerase|uniref:S-adenosylmethionine:tRNA ribosyltransferase-isomerase n=1 Tax=Sinanaerobacter chloroacetimidivorans TaxID=2818044 RepID=A0A8J7VZA3_9FIRM|nr:tRNA preQ1(34) S-adenosylmethionine ribosyltransferase-isomerase QueA [Sinanaerobacter chloroacetimidivorans]MBR0596385.1 tRNA preQ1(34) S-adenosylmethionine ribosyltransferase-isomerase QueA [Sinanaerobacter chloroacetimidivorans]
MHINDFDYYLPEELIAQHPADKRDESRLLVINRSLNTVEHKNFFNILDYINPGDCLVMNNSKVIPARLFGFKEKTGAKVEFLLIKRLENDLWETMVRPGKKLHLGDIVSFGEGKLKAEILDYGEDGTRIVRFHYSGVFLELLDEIGRIPLPPYIERESNEQDKERYQTVYCKTEGSVAAPTAGLHFTEELLEEAKKKGIQTAYVTLHVGIGTFRPVKCDTVEEHKMHFEEYEIDEENAAIINQTKKAGGRIISVGTTSTRTLESAAQADGSVKPGRGNTDIFIYPGYQFKVIDALITNFHLPKSTLLMLVSALYNRETMLKIYEDAVKENYRFFSYGDAMLIL